MPIYEYYCKDCQIDWQETRSISEDTKSVCASCKIDAIRKFSSPVTSFKGEGFYSTDKKKPKGK